MAVPDFIPEGQEHLYPSLRDKHGRIRDYIPEEDEATVAADVSRADLEAEEVARRAIEKPADVPKKGTAK